MIIKLKPLVVTGGLSTLLAVTLGCRGEKAHQKTAPEATAERTPSSTPTVNPTVTPLPDPSGDDAETQIETNTPEPEPELEANPMPTPSATLSPIPTQTPEPVATPKPVDPKKVRAFSLIKKTSNTDRQLLRPLDGVLHEHSLVQKIESLEEVLLSPLRAQALTDSKISQSADPLEITLAADVTLAFSKFSTSGKAVRVNTNGFRLKLIGDDFSNLVIVSKTSERSAGNVEIITLGDKLPELDLSGMDGVDGSHAACPGDFPTCLESTPPRHPDAQTTYRMERRMETREVAFDDVDPLLGNAYKSLIHEVQVSPMDVPFPPPPPWNSKFIWQRKNEPKLELAGRLIVETSWEEPVIESVGQGQDGIAIPGVPGTNGLNGGHVEFKSFSSLSNKGMINVRGGRAGVGGKSGLILPGRGADSIGLAQTASRTLKSHTAHVIWHGFAFGCQPHASNGQCLPDGFSGHAYTFPGHINATEAALPPETKGPFIIPAGNNGAFVDRPPQVDGIAGVDGKIAETVFESLDEFLQNWPKNLALPTAIEAKLVNLVETDKINY